MGDITIDKLITNLKSVNMRTVISESIENTADEVIDAQREQMLHGERSDGKKIGKYKNPKYAKKKYQMNQKAGLGNKDLRLEGPFQEGIFIDETSRGVVFGSTDEKTEKIMEREGELVFGLNKKYASGYSITHLKPEAIRRIRKAIFK